jgi:hypothetical protein
MSPDELGRPTYTARPAVPRHTAEPPQFRDESAGPAGHRPRRAKAAPPQDSLPPQPEPSLRRGSRKKPPKPQEPQEPVVERKKPKKQEPAADDARTVYVPVVVAPHGVGYGIWRVLRFVVMALIWLVRTMVKVALSAFIHA